MTLLANRWSLRTLLLMFLVWPLLASATLNGNYQGSYQGKKVTAVLETMTSTVTGILTIGEERYLLQAGNGGNTISGQLTNMKSGASLNLQIKADGNSLEVDVKSADQSTMHFILNRTQ